MDKNISYHDSHRAWYGITHESSHKTYCMGTCSSERLIARQAKVFFKCSLYMKKYIIMVEITEAPITIIEKGVAAPLS